MSTSAYQIERAVDAIVDGTDATVAGDHYHRYGEDVESSFGDRSRWRLLHVDYSALRRTAKDSYRW